MFDVRVGSFAIDFKYVAEAEKQILLLDAYGPLFASLLVLYFVSALATHSITPPPSGPAVTDLE